MNHLTTIRLEVDIDARRFVQAVSLDNTAIEEEITKGIEMAMKDILTGDNFAQSIRSATKNEIQQIVNKAVLSWEVRSKITKLIEEKIGKKVEEYADKIAEQVTDSLR